MKITRLEAVTLRPLALRKAFSTTNVLLNALNFAVVRLETDAGITGYGEALPAWEVSGETTASVAGCVDLYQDPNRLYASDLLTGLEIGTLDGVRHLVDRMLPVDRPSTVMGNGAAKAAIEQAALDACARHQGVPLHRLLGIEPMPVASAITAGLMPLDQTLAWVEDTLKRRPALIRLKVGGQPDPAAPQAAMTRDIEAVKGARAMIDRAGQAVLLAADANEGFVTPERTITFCKAVSGALDWLEQPFLGDERTGFREVRRHCDVPLMADESLHGLGDAEQLLRLGGVDYFNVKLMKAGGLLNALRIIDLAADHGIRCHIGSMVESSLGCLMGYLAAAARGSQVVGTDMLAFEHLADDPWHILKSVRGHVELADVRQIGTGATAAVLQSLRT